MATWSPNNRACTQTWIALRVLGQSSLTFDVTGDRTMNQLTFFNAASSEEVRRLQAATLANAMDGVFRHVHGASFEPGRTLQDAVKDITETLVNASATVAQLGEKNDANYRFFAEP